jgi:hypothetical protein
LLWRISPFPVYPDIERWTAVGALAVGMFYSLFITLFVWFVSKRKPDFSRLASFLAIIYTSLLFVINIALEVKLGNTGDILGYIFSLISVLLSSLGYCMLLVMGIGAILHPEFHWVFVCFTPYLILLAILYFFTRPKVKEQFK